MMSTFALGQTQVRRSGYGAMQLAGPFAFGTPPDRASAMSVLRAAVAAGVDHIDTAPVLRSWRRQRADPRRALPLPGDGRVDARFDDQLAAMAAARDEGLIAGVGLSNVSLDQLRHAAAGTGIVCVQNLFHLADRRGTSVLEECLSRAARLGITSAHVALQWLLQLAPTCCSSPGPALSPTCGRTWPPKA
jgi:pyridoxine 4-dehydrogenase